MMKYIDYYSDGNKLEKLEILINGIMSAKILKRNVKKLILLYCFYKIANSG